MRCIWQMDGDKVKGFKCEFSPIDMLMIVSGLKYIVADIERHPKDRERAQGIYNQIMLCRYYDDADCKTENSSEIPNNSTISKMEQVEEPTTEDCDYCKMTHRNWYEHCVCCEHKPKDEPQTEAFEEPNYYDPALWE